MRLTDLLAWCQDHVPLLMPHAFRAAGVHDGVHDWCPGWCPCTPDPEDDEELTPAAVAA